MPMKKTHNLKVAGGTYQVDGQEKTRWLTIGGLLRDGDKIKIKLDTIPAGEFNGWVEVFPVEENPGHGAPQSNAGEPFDDDVPF
tara:strand:+ start:107 stop:358 length:252 start_codon:yes stop_codon:yes gene_type:complete